MNGIKRAFRQLGLARDLVQIRSGWDGSDNARDRAATRLATLRGIPQKIGQIYSLVGGEEGTRAFYPLFASEIRIPRRQLRQRLQGLWGEDLDSLFQDLANRGLAGSIGAVFQGTLVSGERVAVKLLHRHVEKEIRTDMRWLKWLPSPRVDGIRQDLSALGEHVQEKFAQETNLSYEQANLKDASRWGLPGLVVPRPYDSLCRKEVLVTSWEEGDSFADVCANWGTRERRALAELLLRFFLEGLFERKRIQADWNPGNFCFRRGEGNVQMVVFDLACQYEPEQGQELALLKLILMCRENRECPLAAFQAAGFDSTLLQPMRHLLPAMAALLFEPFLMDRPYNLEGWRLSDRMQQLLGNLRWNFRMAAPPSLLFLMRAFTGLCYFLRKLQIKVNWSRALSPVLDSRKKDLENFALPEVLQSAFSGLASALKIKVIRNLETRVEMTLPPNAIDSLHEFLDAGLQERIRQRDINISEIIASVRKNGYRPQQLFHLADANEQIHVELV